jgi:hypothetical protein
MFIYLFIIIFIPIVQAKDHTNFLLELEHSNKALPVQLDNRILFFNKKMNAINPDNDYWDKKYNIPVISEFGTKTYIPISDEYLKIIYKNKKIKPIKLNVYGNVIAPTRNIASENKHEKK